MILYCIKNKINNKRYIGITSGRLEKRLQEHGRAICNEQKKNRPFYNAISKYGIENFELEFSKDYKNQIQKYEELEEIEIYYIKKYKTYMGLENCQGYNQTIGGNSGSFGYSRTGEIKKYDLKTLQVIEIYSSMADAQRKTGVKKSEISQCCIGGRSKSAGGFGWCYAGDEPQKYTNKSYKRIKQFNLKTLEVINIFDSVMEASKQTGTNRQGITNCCNHWANSANGFGWCHYDKKPTF
ncbi:MAG: GIY-YIG nuclease family protein [Proteobacteria bacterium]|nr:GIY-YIG nuclease family protein [Pseudomonadota bacterium]